ncbi:hypothetical protein KL86DYS1_12283 [uncultured Dysgonomonas sp.]|uniref:Uncharacterized protein n=1 Tax=uncultured Dysgonomonas sp. TaxID=206096 RepID=A0A212JHG1_9BACT|nr:hypothetical protein KL86DYS1_12283 [uncultured Dysgonomonas sp.]
MTNFTLLHYFCLYPLCKSSHLLSVIIFYFHLPYFTYINYILLKPDTSDTFYTIILLSLTVFSQKVTKATDISVNSHQLTISWLVILRETKYPVREQLITLSYIFLQKGNKGYTYISKQSSVSSQQ